MIGQKVYHNIYGYGQIIQTRNKEFEFLVKFNVGLTLWMRRNEIIFPEPPNPPPEPPPPPPSDDSNKFKARRMIEAFRLGIVPYDCVNDFTVGRDYEIKKINEWLKNSKENILIIIGEYGSGKTHLLHYAFGNALNDNFAVSWVELDPNETPFYKPKQIYARIVYNFKYKLKQNNQVGKFRDFLREIFKRHHFEDNAYLKYLKNNLNDETYLEWIEGNSEMPHPQNLFFIYDTPPGLYNYQIASNIYCYLLSTFGWASKKLLNHEGLLLVFDEAETVNMWNSAYQYSKGLNFLKALIKTSKNDPILLENPHKSGLDYCSVGKTSQIPFIYKIPTSLKLIFAFTSLNWNFTSSNSPLIPEINQFPQIELKRLDDEIFEIIFKHICALYTEAYDFKINNTDKNKVFKKIISKTRKTRLFVKACVEALDLTRFKSEKSEKYHD